MPNPVLQKHALEHGSGGHGSPEGSNHPLVKRRRFARREDEEGAVGHGQFTESFHDAASFPTPVDFPAENGEEKYEESDNTLDKLVVKTDDRFSVRLATSEQSHGSEVSDNGNIYSQLGSSHVSTQSSRRILSHVLPGELAYPTSIFEGEGEPPPPPVEQVSERTAIEQITAEWSRLNGRQPREGDQIYADLSDFSVYKLRGSRQSEKNFWYQWSNGHNELIGLQALNVKAAGGVEVQLFDGVLQFGGVKRYVQAVPFETVSIEGYDAFDSPSVSIWIQSKIAASESADIWVRLGKPSSVYQRYHKPFQWLAMFAKYCTEYATVTENVCLEDFRVKFSVWVRFMYGDKADFRAWLRQHPTNDFTATVVAYRDFLWKEASNVDSVKNARLWKELDLNVIRRQPVGNLAMTIVTPFVHACFRSLYFAECLKPVDLNPALIEAHQNRCHQLSLLDPFTVGKIAESSESYRLRIEKIRPEEIKPGDVVCLPGDTGRFWKEEMFLAYVQRTRIERGRLLWDIIWLYRPSEIPAFRQMHYPFRHELFMSDQCREGEDASQSIGRVNVLWSPSAIPQETTFVRQTYRTEDQSFVTFKRSHLICEHKSTVSVLDRIKAKYRAGHAVLIEFPIRGNESGQDGEADAPATLEPCIIEKHHYNGMTKFRKLLRRDKDSKGESGRPNELLWAEEFITAPTRQIRRACNIRFFPSSTELPTPYDRNGEGDCFFIISGHTEQHERHLNATNFDPLSRLPYRHLNHLSLFAGGGNLDRGLDEGGAIQTKWVIEYSSAAIHTFVANAKSSDDTKAFLGSVDDFLRKARHGIRSALIPSVGDVEVISGGSPCQGYSLLQRQKDSDRSKLNASKVAAFAAYIDHYRPLYAILENVPSISKGCPGDQNAFSQFICTMVAMGYQLNYHHLEAWSFGAPQMRRRAIITIAAPGFELITHPPLTHSTPHSYSCLMSLSIKEDKTEVGMVRRDATPFKYMTAGEAIRDLPDIGDAHVDVCIPFPDHRLSTGGAPIQRLVAKVVPTYAEDRKMMKNIIPLQSLQGAKMASDQGLILPLPSRVVEYVDFLNRNRGDIKSNAYSRLDPDDLFPTIVTKLLARDALAGKGCLHSMQPRPLTLMEARRAQGYPDHEVILGSRAEHMKIIGNSVPRPMALALGLQLRRALLETDPKVVRRALKLVPSSTAENSDAEELGEICELPTRRISPEIVIPLTTPRKQKAPGAIQGERQATTENDGRHTGQAVHEDEVDMSDNEAEQTTKPNSVEDDHQEP